MQFHKHITDSFRFECGRCIENFEIAYHCSPRAYKEGDKVIWICHALTANSDAQQWWPELIGPGRLLDTDKYFVVCSNMPGSPYGTTGPASTDPSTGKPYLLDYPPVTVRDIVNSNIVVRKALGIDHIDFLVGASIGGFQAVEWSIMEPDVIRKAGFIATAARVSPYLTAFMETQRMALEADPSFRTAESIEGGKAGLSCARAIALISYRCYEGYAVRQSETDENVTFAARACSYERHQGEKFIKRFDAYSYLSLANSVDSQNAGRGRGGVAAALGTIRADVTVIAIDSDCIFPPYDMEKMAESIPGAAFHTIHSSFGHDGFLLEHGQIENIIEPILED